MIRLAIIFVFVLTAHAQRAPHSDGYAAFRIGYFRLEKVDSGSLNLGLAAGIHSNKWLSLEGSVDYHTADYDAYNRSTYAFQASLLLYPFGRPNGIQPYLVAGAGYYFSDTNDVEGIIDVSEEWSGDGGTHAGFGFDVALTDRAFDAVSLTFDSRWLFTEEEMRGEGVESDGLLVTLGVKYRF